LPPVYQLTILAPDHTVFEGRVASLVAPGSEGYFGVLARHAPMVAGLGPGEFSIMDDGGQRRFFAVSGGYLEVGWEGVTALVDAAESADAIDVGRARAAEERAERRLRSRERDVDTARAETALRRALNRLRVAEKRGGQR
jgi:F-type H+-transporting ATPase subunit epsilon